MSYIQLFLFVLTFLLSSWQTFFINYRNPPPKRLLCFKPPILGGIWVRGAYNTPKMTQGDQKITKYLEGQHHQVPRGGSGYIKAWSQDLEAWNQIPRGGQPSMSIAYPQGIRFDALRYLPPPTWSCPSRYWIFFLDPQRGLVVRIFEYLGSQQIQRGGPHMAVITSVTARLLITNYPLRSHYIYQI